MVARYSRASLPRQRTGRGQAYLEADAQSLEPTASPAPATPPPANDGAASADPATLGRRAQGLPLWGVLRGDVDSFGVRLRRLQTIEEHVQLSVLYKQFFAGELEVLCSLPEFWKKVTILYSGGDDFAVYGAWDALLALGRELQRLFHRFTEENLKDFPGAEAKTISMGLALAAQSDRPLPSVYEAGWPQSRFGQGGRKRLHLCAGPRARMEAARRRGGFEGPDRPHDGRGAPRASS